MDIKSFEKPTGVRTFEMIQYINGWLEGGMSDWPAQIQDAIMAALGKKAEEVGLPLTIVACYCDMDYGETREKDRPFIRVIASEIVVKDVGFISEAERAIQQAIKGSTKH